MLVLTIVMHCGLQDIINTNHTLQFLLHIPSDVIASKRVIVIFMCQFDDNLLLYCLKF